MHAYCMEWLEPKLQPGASVLDVGCGSGYLLATFYELCKNPSDGKAHIYGIEHVEELAEFMGLAKLVARTRDATLQMCWEGLLPRDNPRDTRY